MSDYAHIPSEPKVNEVRGALLALLIIPVGVVAWGILWNFGFIASIVGFVVAFGAMFFYRLGTGGRLSRVSVILITVITLVTLCLAFFGGMVLDGLSGFSKGSGISELDLFFDSRFWDSFFVILNQPGVVSGYMGDFLLALLFGALGCFGVIRSAFRATSARAAAATAQSLSTPVAGTVPPADAEWPTVAGTVPPADNGAPVALPEEERPH